MTTAKKPTGTGSNPGGYSYMELLTEFKLLNQNAEWMTQAACRGMDFHVFFPETGKAHVVPQAKAVCMECRVRQKCLDWADENQIFYGIWGGLTVTERKRRAKLNTNE